jgi:hypothetical protein
MASAHFRRRTERGTNEVARQAVAMGARNHSAHRLVYLGRAVAAVHHDGPVAKQRSNSFHNRRHQAQVCNNDRDRSVVQSEPRRLFGERKFLQREML